MNKVITVQVPATNLSVASARGAIGPTGEAFLMWRGDDGTWTVHVTFAGSTYTGDDPQTVMLEAMQEYIDRWSDSEEPTE